MDSEKALIEYINIKAKEYGYTDLKITNIRMNSKNTFLADIAFTWYLNGWDKHAELKDSVFVYKNKEWHSPLFQ